MTEIKKVRAKKLGIKEHKICESSIEDDE